MIVLVFQKKFVNQNFYSLEVDKENENYDFSFVDENSFYVLVRSFIDILININLFYLKRGGDILKIKDNGV